MMRKVLLSIPPALSTLLFCAHLLYHGVPLAAAGRAAWRTHPSGREGCGRHAPSRTSSRALCLRMGESRREDRHAKARDGRFDSSCA